MGAPATKLVQDDAFENVPERTRGEFAVERFDYLYEHYRQCISVETMDGTCPDCKLWERVCKVLLKVWEK